MPPVPYGQVFCNGQGPGATVSRAWLRIGRSSGTGKETAGKVGQAVVAVGRQGPSGTSAGTLGCCDHPSNDHREEFPDPRLGSEVGRSRPTADECASNYPDVWNRSDPLLTVQNQVPGQCQSTLPCVCCLVFVDGRKRGGCGRCGCEKEVPCKVFLCEAVWVLVCLSSIMCSMVRRRDVGVGQQEKELRWDMGGKEEVKTTLGLGLGQGQV